MQREIHPFFDLSGRVAIVTGGGSGLGREFCDVLAEFGADIICPDLHKDRAEETCGSLFVSCLLPTAFCLLLTAY